MIETVRRSLGRQTRRLIAGQGEPSVVPTRADDHGLFGPDSATWIVHRDTAMLIGGVRSLLLQTLHPLAMAGVADHSDYRADPLGRLHRTASFLGRTVFGPTAVAEQALAQVRAIHSRVEGLAPDGRAYRADDPHLLGWVHATEIESFLVAHRRYGATTLSTIDADRYVDEMARIGLALGMTDAPRSVADLDEVIRGYRRELAATTQSRDAVRFLVFAPLPILARAPYGVLLAAATGLLPGWSRRLLRLPIPPLADPLLIRPAATALVRTLGWALAPER